MRAPYQSQEGTTRLIATGSSQGQENSIGQCSSSKTLANIPRLTIIKIQFVPTTSVHHSRNHRPSSNLFLNLLEELPDPLFESLCSRWLVMCTRRARGLVLVMVGVVFILRGSIDLVMNVIGFASGRRRTSGLSGMAVAVGRIASHGRWRR